jgi:predicted amidohydrolase YtcJ
MVVLTNDIFKIDPVEIEKTRVRMTVVDGRVVYDAGGAGER